MTKLHKSIGVILSLLLGFNGFSQSFPSIDKKIVFAQNDFSSIEKLMNDGLPNQAIKELLIVQKKAIEEKNIYNFHQCMVRLMRATDYAGMEASELQDLFFSQHEIYYSLSGPIKNVAALDMTGWFQKIRYRNVFSFDDESLVWNLEGKKVTLKNYNAEPIIDNYELEYLRNDRELMRIASEQIYDTNQLKYQPTLYDVLATNYLNAYRYTESADSCNWENTLEYAQKDLSNIERIYANLEQLHQANERWETYAYWLEQRLNNCSNEHRTNKNMLDVYEKFQMELAGFSASNRFAFRRAEIYAEQGGQWDWKNMGVKSNGFNLALEVIDNALSTHSKAEFNENLIKLKKQILDPSLDMSFDGDIRPSAHNFMKIQYRNLVQTELLIFRVTEYIQDNEQEENPFKRMKFIPIAQRQLSFHEDPNHLFHSKDFMLTELSEPGQYLIVAAATFEAWQNALKAEKWHEIKNIAYEVLWLSNLTMRKSNEKSGMRLLVNDIHSGKPIKNAIVKVADGNYRNNKAQQQNYKTDKNGSVLLSGNRRSHITVTYKNDSIYDYAYFYENRKTKNNFKRIFTDRSIYRPGQIVYFKTLNYSNNGDSPFVASGYPTQVEFKDPNGKILYYNTLTSNDFGSTSGSFVLPKSGFPLGSVSVYTDGDYAATIRVEEYKRPTYLVSFETPKSKIVLGEKVSMEGKVMAFAGYPITNVEVEISVSEYRYFPRWCVVLDEDRQYDTTIVVKTDENGIFKLDFLPKNPKETNGVFYAFDASVVDLTGETQSANYSMFVGKSAYSISANVTSKYRSDQLGKVLVNVQNSQGINQEGKTIQYFLKRKEPQTWYRFTREETEFQSFTKEELKEWKPDLLYFSDEKAKSSNLIYSGDVQSGEEIDLSKVLNESAGEFELIFRTIDELGDTINLIREFILWNPDSKKGQHQTELWMEALNPNPILGEKVKVIIGTSHKKARLFLATYNEDGLLKMNYKKIRKRKKLKLEFNNELKNGVAVYAGLVKKGIISSETIRLTPIDSSRIINIKLKNIQEPLRPGSEQKWEMEITQKGNSINDAELLTSMYDASLDQITGHYWNPNLLPMAYISVNWSNTYAQTILMQATTWPQAYFYKSTYLEYEMEPQYDEFRGGSYAKEAPVMIMDQISSGSGDGRGNGMGGQEIEEVVIKDPKMEESKNVKSVRENFNETAYFYPQIHSDAKGNYKWTFTLPDALTKWKMMAMAHTKDVKGAYFTKSFEARKELMLETFEPRFWRKGDSIVWIGKVTNLSEKEQNVMVKLKFTNPISEEDISSEYGNFIQQNVTLAPNESKAVEWGFIVPENAPILVNFEAEATTADFSDIVRKPTPILSGTEIITMAENFTLDEKGSYDLRLRDLEKISEDAKLLSYSIQVQPQPLWGTLLSLAQLMEPKNELTESYFTQYFSTQLAQKILNENPDMKRALQTWKLTDEDALSSALNKNEELKTLLLSETVWVIDAENETQKLRRLGQLLDDVSLKAISNTSWAKLKELQLNNGAWSWVGKERTSWYITQYIANGLAWLKETQISVDEATFGTIVQALNSHYKDQFNMLKKADREKGLGLNASVIQWLYIRSFTDVKEDSASIYYSSLVPKYWKDFELSTQALMGLWSLKKESPELTNKLKASIMDRARKDSVLGTYWLENKCGYGWYENNIETHSMLIEFLTKAGQSPKDIQAMQMWLLQQKRTQLWDSPKSTAMACYALQKFGNKNTATKTQKVILKIQNEAEVIVPNEKVSFSYKPEIQNWTQAKSHTSIQVFEDAPVFTSMQITYSDKAANIQKTTGDFRVERNYYLLKKGEEIAINENQQLETGDILRVKIKLVSNRLLDFVYLEDPKASGWEPMNALSGYQYANGLYYLSNRDSKTEFFIENVNKGTHNYVYDIKVTAKGNFHVGPTKAMCYYAPTFVANTQGEVFMVK
jgi:hypothetical protein